MELKTSKNKQKSQKVVGPIHRSGCFSAGFTLIELLVVLVMLGAVTGLAMPNFIRLYESLQHKLVRDTVVNDVRSLTVRAISERRPFLYFDTLDDERLAESPFYHQGYRVTTSTLPGGWQLKMSEPIVIYPTGVCGGGEVTLVNDAELYGHIVLTPPYCKGSSEN